LERSQRPSRSFASNRPLWVAMTGNAVIGCEAPMAGSVFDDGFALIQDRNPVEGATVRTTTKPSASVGSILV
jgi:hypothetical protein